MTTPADLLWSSTPVPGPWREHAACRDHPVALFFPEVGRDGHEGQAVCRTCPVIAECRVYARAHPSLHGIWAGEGEHARARRRWRR